MCLRGKRRSIMLEGHYKHSGVDDHAWLTCLVVDIENRADLRGTKETNLQYLGINYVSYSLLANRLTPTILKHIGLNFFGTGPWAWCSWIHRLMGGWHNTIKSWPKSHLKAQLEESLLNSSRGFIQNAVPCCVDSPTHGNKTNRRPIG